MLEPKTSEEHANELTLSEEIQEHKVEQIGGTVVESLEISLPQVSLGMMKPKAKKRSSEAEPKELAVAFPNFLHESVVSLLKYLDGKREKYAVSAEARFYVEMLRNRTHSKRAATVKIAKEMTRECAAVTASLKVCEEQLRAKYMECEVLWLNLAKEKELCEDKELRIKDLRREIATMKTKRMELRARIVAQTEAHTKEMQRANKLMASLAEQTKKHKAELANWAKRLTECETVKCNYTLLFGSLAIIEQCLLEITCA